MGACQAEAKSNRDLLDSTRLGLELAAAVQSLYPGKIDFTLSKRLIGSDDFSLEAKQQAAKAADATASAVSKGSLFGAIALILGAIAGWFGGRAGTIVPTLTSAELRAGIGR